MRGTGRRKQENENETKSLQALLAKSR